MANPTILCKGQIYIEICDCDENPPHYQSIRIRDTMNNVICLQTMDTEGYSSHVEEISEDQHCENVKKYLKKE
jgi:hypothetical protein